MLPTLNGRIQTRIFLLVVVGGLWTLVITPALPGLDDDLGANYRTTFILLIATLVLGIGWELIYHFIQQFRWEKDWPTFFGLITVINEGILLWILIQLDAVPYLEGTVPLAAFVILFLTTWILVWLGGNGPMRVPFVHWRFRGGRLV
ncbi:MAG: hypothetical protein ACRDRH_04780 [Pseudonocardia sp.]